MKTKADKHQANKTEQLSKKNIGLLRYQPFSWKAHGSSSLLTDKITFHIHSHKAVFREKGLWSILLV